MDKKITFTGKMDEKDFTKLFNYQTGSKLIFIIPIYFAIFAGLLFILKIYKSFNLSILTIILLSFTASIIFVVVYVLLLYSRLKKEFMQDIASIKEQQYIIDEDRISILVEGRKTDIFYKDLKKIKESKNFFILNHKANVMIAIPKRFIDNKDISQVKEVFKNLTPNPKEGG
jgi:hypothetical protein